jgi:hypothetical protein
MVASVEGISDVAGDGDVATVSGVAVAVAAGAHDAIMMTGIKAIKQEIITGLMANLLFSLLRTA